MEPTPPVPWTYRHLRLAPAPAVMWYFHQTVRWQMLGNEGFALELEASMPDYGQVESRWMLFHSWLPQMIMIDEPQAAIVRALQSGVDVDRAAADFVGRLQAMGWCLDEEADLDHLMARVTSEILAMQNPLELWRFARFVRELAPRTVVEIGTARGGTLYCLCQLADPDAVVISIDLPSGAGGGGQTEEERRFFTSFAGPSQRLHCLAADSHAPETRARVEALLGGREIDLLFLDGDHTTQGVKADFEQYQPLVSGGGVIALHDICVRPEVWGPQGGVGPFWDRLKARYATREIIDTGGRCHPNLPPGVRPAWGIGLVTKGG